MLIGGCNNLGALRQFQAENVFEVVGDPGCVAVAPFVENFVRIGHSPIGKLAAGGVDPRFFEYFAAGGVVQRFITFTATGDRLPESWMRCTL